MLGLFEDAGGAVVFGDDKLVAVGAVKLDQSGLGNMCK
jgi:hypothetical protein